MRASYNEQTDQGNVFGDENLNDDDNKRYKEIYQNNNNNIMGATQKM